MITSASRRTDIPAFHGEWLLSRLAAGETQVRNPMNRAQIRQVSLKPEDVDCIVFWTKDPRPLMPLLPRIDRMGHSYYFQFTLTPYGRELEPGLLEKEGLPEAFSALSKALGPERVLWRYDPIVLNETWTVKRHLLAFSRMCERLEGLTEQCTVSFVDYYPRRKRAFESGLLREPTAEETAALSLGLAETAGKHGLRIRACCESRSLALYGIEPASCIERELIERICGRKVPAKPDRNQRPGCGCVSSVDIGTYNTCGHGCVYCYASWRNGG